MGKRTTRCGVLAAALLFVSCFGAPFGCLSEQLSSGTPVASADPIPDRYGLAILYANTYKPVNDIGFLMAAAVAIFDYEKIWHHKAPEPLRFKIEVSAGSAVRDKSGFVGAANIFALYYLGKPATFRPYVEGGVGGIYTSFRVEGQGLRFNFNPQLGVGIEFNAGNPIYFTAVRLHHISNGGLHHDNRGINSVALQVGRYF